MELTLRAFFFNAATDYLPYYKNFTIEIDEAATAEQMLAAIKERERNFSYPDTKLFFRVNGLVVGGDEPIKNIADKLGTDLQIDPLSSYRAVNGLVINDDDFMQSFACIVPLASEEDKAYFQSLYALHYASETFSYSHEYIGDAVLLTANRMIQANESRKEEILAAISDPETGLPICEYENNLFQAEDHTATIASLQAMAQIKVCDSFADKVCESLARKAKAKPANVALQGSSVALYLGTKHAADQLGDVILGHLDSVGATYVPFDKATRKAGQSLMSTNKTMAYRKAGTMLLEAFDSGAEILVCAEEDDAVFLQKNIGNIERAMGRDIPLTILSRAVFLEMRNRAA